MQKKPLRWEDNVIELQFCFVSMASYFTRHEKLMTEASNCGHCRGGGGDRLKTTGSPKVSWFNRIFQKVHILEGLF